MEDFSVRADSLDRVEVILHEPEYFAVEGAVFDEKGNPVAGIPVDLDSTGGLVLTFRSSATVTSGDGRFIMEHIPGGTLFRFSVRNGLGVSASFQAENVRQPLRIVLPSADRWLEGTVRDADGKPMAGIILHISSDTGQAGATTDRSGHFRVEGLAAKQVVLYYSGLLDFFEFHGVATNERRDFILPTGRHYLSGRVTDIRNKPISGAAVEITRKEKWGWPVVIQTDSRGHFYFSALGQRSVTLRVSSPGYREQIRPVQTDREDVRFRLEKAANE
jgi:hypothetical protein